MKVSVIVPTNNIKRITKFINSYSKLENFKQKVKLIIIGNGEVVKSTIQKDSFITFIRYDKSFNIIPFVELRGIGMNKVYADFFLFLDDDHIFKKGADNFLIECLNFLKNHNECGVLQLKKKNEEKYGFYPKRNAHIWTDRGLFIRRINQFDYKEYYKLIGACEDLLYSYEVLSQSYIPYIIHNTPIDRGCTLSNNHKELNHPSYNKKLLDDNIIGYIRKKYNQKDWKFYGSLTNLTYPIHLKNLIKSRLANLI